MDKTMYNAKIWDFSKIDSYLLGCLKFASIELEGDTIEVIENARTVNPQFSYDSIVAIIIESLDYACKFIKDNDLDIEKYDFVFDKLNHYSNLLSDHMGIDWEYQPTDKELEVAFNKYYEDIQNQAIEDNLIEYLREGIDDNANSINDDDLFNEYQDYLTSKVVESRNKKNPNYKHYQRLRRYFVRLYSLAESHSSEKSIKNYVLNYKVDNEPQLSSYFDYSDISALDNLLSKEIKDKAGKRIAVVLRALEANGVKRIEGLKPLHEKILIPKYGAKGTQQAIAKYMNEDSNQTIADIKTATKKYEKHLNL